jgi:hypothetical protein
MIEGNRLHLRIVKSNVYDKLSGLQGANSLRRRSNT